MIEADKTMDSKIKMVITDLDGTLLYDNLPIATENIEALRELRAKGIYCVIATGRSLFSLYKVIPADFPLDYLIFSTGTGIMNWQQKEIISSQHLKRECVEKIVAILLEFEVDFMVHETLPENHKFYYFGSDKPNPDFARRIALYHDHAQRVRFPIDIDEAAQCLVILRPDQLQLFDMIKQRLDFVKVVRTTSPLDHRSIWLEIFPKHVSKGKAAAELAERLGLSADEIIGIGNDYNDIDLLDWTRTSFVVNNAPPELKEKYHTVRRDDHKGFYQIIKKLL